MKNTDLVGKKTPERIDFTDESDCSLSCNYMGAADEAFDGQALGRFRQLTKRACNELLQAMRVDLR